MRFTEKDFEKFEVSAEELAPWLLGKIICRRLTDGKILHFRILETESYGDNDSQHTPTNIRQETLQLHNV